jgi:DNA-binding NarL/FixJ family response regulator
VTIRVLLCDDQALVRNGFSLILKAEEDIDVVGEAADGAEAVELTKRLLPNVVLMDVRMPGMNGIDATRRILASGVESRVLILTTFDIDEYVYEALRAGAKGSSSRTSRPPSWWRAYESSPRGRRCSRRRSRAACSSGSRRPCREPQTRRHASCRR